MIELFGGPLDGAKIQLSKFSNGFAVIRCSPKRYKICGGLHGLAEVEYSVFVPDSGGSVVAGYRVNSSGRAMYAGSA